MVKARVAILLVMLLCLTSSFGQSVYVAADGYANPSSIPDANAYRMVYLSWAALAADNPSEKFTPKLQDIGFSDSDINIIEQEMSGFLAQFDAVTLTSDQDNVVSQTTAYLQNNLSGPGASTLSSYVLGERGGMQIYTVGTQNSDGTYTPDPQAGSHTVTHYFYAYNGNINPILTEEAAFYGDTWLSDNGQVTCSNWVYPPSVAYNGTTTTGSQAGNYRSWIFRNVSPTPSTGQVSERISLDVGNPYYCGPHITQTLGFTLDIEYAYTRVRNISGNNAIYNAQYGYYTWTVSPACSNVPVWAFPDWDPTTMRDAPLLPTPWGWDTEAVCSRIIGSKWECVDTIFFPAKRYNTNVGPKNCTYNP